MIGGIQGRFGRARLKHGLAPHPAGPLVRLGSSYGGWVVPEGLVQPASVVYSAGVGEDVSFDLELIARTRCNVWAFDPTPRAIQFAREIEEKRFHFLPVGVASRDEMRRFYEPTNPEHVSYSVMTAHDDRGFFDAVCKSVDTIARELGHGQIDLLKLDIEGAEYEILGSVKTPVRCICVELHPIRPISEIVKFVRELEYDVVHVDGWNATLIRCEGAAEPC